MLKTPSLLLMKPLVQHVRFVVMLLSTVSIYSHAQVSIDTAKQDPTPAPLENVKPTAAPTAHSTATTTESRKEKFLLPHGPKNALPYCDDLTGATIQAQPTDSTIADADHLRGQVNDNLILNGKACVARNDMRVQGDQINYDYPSEQVAATGHAVMRNGAGDEVSGQVIQYNLATQKAEVDNSTFKINATEGRGKAESLAMLSSRRALMQEAYYTTCRAEDPDWYLKSKTLLVDQDSDLATGTSSVLIFKNLPILATPYMQFPIGNRRQSGLLTPTLGISTSTGVDLVVPYYFNLAPNYDLTLYPGITTKRGVKLGGEYRYLTRQYGQGSIYANYLPNDKLTDSQRHYWRIQHSMSGDLGEAKWQVDVDAQRASDNAYLDDIRTPNTNASNRILTSEYAVQLSQGNWTTRLRQKTNQTLQDATNSVSVPYDFEPQLSITGAERQGNWVANVDIESTRFTHPNTSYAEGWRHVAYPSIRYEYRNAAGFVIPKVGLYATQYNLSRVDSAYDKDPSRILPITSLDTGLIFERDNAKWLGQPVIQTLEPRAYYLYIPYRDQSKIWNFDSALADFDLSHIYGENIFTGRDRIGEANQVSLGLTSRWLAQATGEQLFQITAAQRHYFQEQRVTLPGGTTNSNRKSDLLLSASGQVEKHFWLDTFAQYNFDNSKLLKFDFNLRWQPALKKVINIGFNKNSISSSNLTRSVYASAQWPLSQISKSLYGVSRIKYDLESNRISEGIIGIEYVKDCWVFRLLGERTISSSTNTASNSIFFQLELKGLGALGNSDPRSTFENNVAGYQAVKFEDSVDETPASSPISDMNKR
ncbi:LPS-assembly protein LptD [Hydromonas duriensis]|uniref:LPS-assembly protein LptD n=1 Tax=Hydromonas duriensis TaxID=1527608 RepID=A0A4R6Y868_9BURK|nr:LPS-assembly protein LptD [Hydromonas duriensis]TDR31559.1 LPS-assembly protein [Hydromonas duriensis]